MGTGIQAYAAGINRHHQQAQAHASRAIEHAIEAGKLLLQAKAQLPHGQFLSWLEANCQVSARQAQRYMRAAQGRPLGRRKNDTVSHMPKPVKELRILDVLRSGQSLNRFEATKLGDSCLNSTIAKLRAKGEPILSRWERIPGRFSDEVRCLRYYYEGTAQRTPQLDLIEAPEDRG